MQASNRPRPRRFVACAREPPALKPRIGIDTGGTFTDVVAFDPESGRLLFHKVHSTPDAPGRALVTGIQEAAARLGSDPRAVALLVHGTTVATNTVLQRTGARVAMITTAGFRDVLHIQRQSRPRLYDLRARRAEALVPRERRLELNERIAWDGSVLTPIDPAELAGLVERLRAEKVEAVAVGLLHSYANPAHELAVGETLRRNLPDATVCLSHELVREHGEYERFSTCAMNAAVQPVMQRYLARLDGALRERAITAPLFVMKSNGGVMAAPRVAEQCVQTILSGPAGGVVAGAAIARRHTNANLITADMGGTSFDVAVIDRGTVGFAREARIAGHALQVPMLDLHTVGAGGGSIGWIDAGGSLRVGPRSAGADPGPACYGRGGREPTITDANLALGRLAEQSRLGGGMALDGDASRRVLHDRLAGPLGLTIEHAAEGMVRVVNASMVAAIRRLTVERGLDPRDFTLCAFGGAGPLHGAELAREMGIGETLVPLAPGVTSALGLLMSNLREDRVRTLVTMLDAIEPAELTARLDELDREARAPLAAIGLSGSALRSERRLGLRYHGQGYDLPVALPDGPVDLVAVREAFHDAHRRLYGYAAADQPVELVSLWLAVEMDLQAIDLPEVPAATTAPVPQSRRPVWFAGERADTPVYDRADLGAGAKLTGPAIVEQADTTVVVWPGQPARVDRHGQMLMGEGTAQ